MTPQNALPFPRGTTFQQGLSMSPGDQTFKDMEGKIFFHHDSVHKTGQMIKLRCVKNDTGAAITVKRGFMMFSTTDAYDFGNRVTSYATAGAVCKPLDDAYTVGFSIPDDDLFWLVEEGPCGVLTEASAISLSAGNVVASDASGLVNGTPCAQASEYAAGSIGPAAVTISTEIVVYVTAGLSRIGT